MHPESPSYIPIILPNDAAALEHLPHQAAIMLSAVYGSNPRLEPLIRGARQRCDTLLVDPKTPHFQFEGYMSMPDYRALPYSPGRATLGTLWEPARFARAEARRELIDSVFALQRDLGADVLLAPYFYVPHAEHRWLEVARTVAAEAIEAADTPVGVPLCVDIDALLDHDRRDKIVDAFAGLAARTFWVTVVNYDERRADPRDADALMAFLAGLIDLGNPVVLSHAGRTGLLAIAAGAAGYAAGSHGLEAHPRSFFREMMGSRVANRYYLHECCVHLPVRTAEACLRLDDGASHPACHCAACDGAVAVSRFVSRRLALHAMLRRFSEVEELAAIPTARRLPFLVDRFGAAGERAAALAAELSNRADTRIDGGEYHYLEVLREAAGGPPATVPGDDMPD